MFVKRLSFLNDIFPDLFEANKKVCFINPQYLTDLDHFNSKNTVVLTDDIRMYSPLSRAGYNCSPEINYNVDISIILLPKSKELARELIIIGLEKAKGGYVVIDGDKKDGIISIQPLNAEPGQEIIVGQIGTTRGTENVKLVKSLDGYIRTEEGGVPEPDQLSTIISGFLESSNVKSVDQLVAGIEQSRAYEINVKFITTAKELDEAGASLMRIPN